VKNIIKESQLEFFLCGDYEVSVKKNEKSTTVKIVNIANKEEEVGA
jgi:hypothetical protein